jgi:hypothetical protein
MTLSRAPVIGFALFLALYGASHLAVAEEILSVDGGGTGSSSFEQGSLLFMGSSTISQSNANLFWDDLNQRLGIGTTTPSRALEFGVNKGIQLSTDNNTHDVTGLIRLQSLTDEAKATIAYLDKTGQEVIWLQTHDYLTYPTNRHKHSACCTPTARDLRSASACARGLQPSQTAAPVCTLQ